MFSSAVSCVWFSLPLQMLLTQAPTLTKHCQTKLTFDDWSKKGGKNRDDEGVGRGVRCRGEERMEEWGLNAVGNMDRLRPLSLLLCQLWSCSGVKQWFSVWNLWVYSVLVWRKDSDTYTMTLIITWIAVCPFSAQQWSKKQAARHLLLPWWVFSVAWLSEQVIWSMTTEYEHTQHPSCPVWNIWGTRCLWVVCVFLFVLGFVVLGFKGEQ